MDNNVTPMKAGQPVVVDPMQALLNKAELIRNETTAKLDAKISRDVISKREAGNGRTLDYLEGWYVIARMNEVFGQGNWSYVVDDMRLVFQGEVNGKQTVHYVAKVSVRAMGTIFSDYGYGDGTDKFNIGKAHELAVKEAVTDAVKRCCKNFGMSMGLALYDKSQENVDEGESSAGAGDSKRAAANKPTSSKTVTVHSDTSPSISGSIVADGGTNQTPISSKAKSRDELNVLLTALARTAVAKRKFAGVGAVRELMKTKYGADSKESLTDAQASEFVDYLNTVINQE